MEEKIPFIDMHCDTLMQAWFRGRHQVWHLPSAMLDGERLAQGGAKGQFFAIFLQSMRLKRLAGATAERWQIYRAPGGNFLPDAGKISGSDRLCGQFWSDAAELASGKDQRISYDRGRT